MNEDGPQKVFREEIDSKQMSELSARDVRLTADVIYLTR